MTDSSGTVVWAADYKPFGEATITVGTITNNLRFPGQYYDTETGLNYNLNRDYNQVIGRYIEADPIGINGGLNLYLYAAGNPIVNQDDDGLQCFKQIMLVTAYCDVGPGKDWNYYKPKNKGDNPGSVGPGTCAVANTKPPAYKFGCKMKVVDDSGNTVYSCEVHDTGSGWNNKPGHHNVGPEEWIDIWIGNCKEAKKWGKKWMEVEVCCDDKCPK